MSTSTGPRALHTGRQVLGRSGHWPIATGSSYICRSPPCTAQIRYIAIVRSLSSNPVSPLRTRRPTACPTSITCGSSTRTFFSLPDISKLAKLASNATSAIPASGGKQGQVETDGDKQIYHARKILPYSQKQLYQLVADIPSYSSFIPFCTSSAVLSPSRSSSSSKSLPKATNGGRRQIAQDWKPPVNEAFEVDAELRVGFGGFEEAYTSRVIGTPWESVRAEAGEAPLFESLSTTWSFSPASTFSPHPSSTIPSSSSATPSSAPSTTHLKPARTSTEMESSSGPTLLTIDLAFEFTNPLHRIASQAVLPKVADKMVEAFEKRCLEVWGKGRD